jgi:sugar phosphate isomerase/epimerase
LPGAIEDSETLKLAFSTLGCPDWELSKIAEAAQVYGFDGIELRAIAGELDLLNRLEFQKREVATTRQWLTDQGLSICCLDTSCRFDSPDENERSTQIEVAIKYAELAAALGAPLIRVFPDSINEGSTREKTRDHIAESLREVAIRAQQGVSVGLETHGDFARGSIAAEIVGMANHPNVKLIWDVANSLAAGDSIEIAARDVAPFLAHVHLRDAQPVDGEQHWLPVLAGRGEVSFHEVVNALTSLNYDGYISFEWEKYWHPEIEEPEVALPDFARAIRRALNSESPSVSSQQ